MNIETERKFLIKYLPKDYEKYSKMDIEQAYLSIDKEHRIRKNDNLYYETFKGEGNLSRTEIEKEITKDQYDNLYNKIISRVIYKTRYIIPYKDNNIELNIYKKELSGLIVAEVEFNSVEESNEFIPPIWFGKEVTFDNKFKNQYLATCSLEEINIILKDLRDNK